MSGQPGSSSGQNGATPKAIANLAKRQEDITRRGSSKMKFVPVLPVRRKKEELKPDAKVEKPTPGVRGRGRGIVRGRGRGDARGGAPRIGHEMVATGPLALGPTMTGSAAAKRAAPRSNFSSAPPLSSASGGSTPSSLGSGLTRSTAPTLKRDPSDPAKKLVEVETETYSDPEDGVEIVDIDDVRRMDWMAPESLRKERVREKRRRSSVKRETSRDKGKVKAELQDVALGQEEEQVDLANALDLSDSEEEEELEDIFNDFALQEDEDMDLNVRQEKLFFFQFPEPFPTFHPRESAKSQDVDMTDATVMKQTDKGKSPEGSEKAKKVVTFAPDVKPPASMAGTPSVDGAKNEESPSIPLDGVIGRLEVYQSGAVKLRLENGILLDVTAATQPSFLQHAVHVDPEKRRLSVIGEVNRRFVVSPDIDALLESVEVEEKHSAMDVDYLELGSIKTEEGKKSRNKT